MTKFDSQSSFEDFMSEDKLPPVFPSSQSSNVSDTLVYSQHLISEFCDRETYGPFGIETKETKETEEDDLLNFLGSSLAYSPKSISPHSPSDGSSCLTFSSSTLDPLDIAPGQLDTYDMRDDNILNIENVNHIENHEFTGTSDIDFSCLIPLSSITTPTPPPTPIPTSVPEATPLPISVPVETSESCINKKPSTRGRKRKLFNNCDSKKKDQNKEAARRYREKTKQQVAELEAEEGELIKTNKKLRMELEIVTRTHREFVLWIRDCRKEARRK
ncbi:uncharacterized protein LOC128386828 [Panonychus citri]|uniref:uncharacterized protein LOC128386828 n=1 Tax=Panonychus citri TaxID=50023 RepID=UPI0023078BFC|nr:uncharacterized protein LOC128386828 [Panonychus citri]